MSDKAPDLTGVVERLDEIERLAKEATPGEWKQGEWGGQCHLTHKHSGPPICIYDPVFYPEELGIVGGASQQDKVLSSDYDGLIVSAEDVAFIAAANPAFLLELIASYRTLLSSHKERGERLSRIADYEWPVVVGEQVTVSYGEASGEPYENKFPIARETGLQAFRAVQQIARTALSHTPENGG